jgi:hypothetical protein
MIVSIVMVPMRGRTSKRRPDMWVVELNIAGIQILRRARKRRHLLRLNSGPVGLRIPPPRAA